MNWAKDHWVQICLIAYLSWMAGLITGVLFGRLPTAKEQEAEFLQWGESYPKHPCPNCKDLKGVKPDFTRGKPHLWCMQCGTHFLAPVAPF